MPPALLVTRYFATEKLELDQLQVAYDEAAQALESFLEENSGEDGLLADAMNDKEKVTATSVKARLKVTTDKEEKGWTEDCSGIVRCRNQSQKSA